MTPRPSPGSISAFVERRRSKGVEGGIVGGWRRFAGPRFRAFHAVGFSQGAVGALAGGAVTTPLMLALGGPPAFVLIASVLPGLGSLSQLALPWILRRTGGNLRGVTLLLAVIGDTRGFWYGGIIVLVVAGVISHQAALAALVVLSLVVGMVGGLSGSNLLAWYHAVLPERERRFVSPRTGVVGAIAGAALLIPTALLLHDINVSLVLFAIPLFVAGLASLVGICGLLRLPRPGRVTVPDRRRITAERPADLDRFVRVSTFGAIGFGLGPPLSIYAIVVLGLPPGFTIALAAIATLASVVAAAVVGSMLERGSAAGILRAAHGIRAVAMGLGLLAFPGNPIAGEMLIIVAILGASGDAASGLASSERILRLSVGPAAIAHQARYVAATSSASASAQIAASGVLAFGSAFGYPVYAALFLASGAVRVVTVNRLAPGRLEPVMTGQPIVAASGAAGN